MAKIILIGVTGAGKTTLVQALKKEKFTYKKTQSATYYQDIIDLPGEYLEIPRYINAIITLSFDVDIIVLVQDSTSEETYFPPNFGDMFSKKVIGVVTKIDMDNKNIERAKKWLKLAGAQEIIEISAYDNYGIEELSLVIGSN